MAEPARQEPARTDRDRDSEPMVSAGGLAKFVAAVAIVIAVAAGILSLVDSPSTSRAPQTALSEAPEPMPEPDTTKTVTGRSAPYVASREAQSQVRQATSAMESCFSDRGDYGSCDSADEIEPWLTDVELADEPGPGEISLYGDSETMSITGADSDGYLWSYERGPDGTVTRGCHEAGELTPCSTPTW